MSWIEEEVELYIKSLFFDAKAEAARILEKLKELKGKGDYSEGRFMALQGLLAAVHEGDREALFIKAKESMNLEEMREVREIIATKAESQLIDDFDRGFSEQWITILDLLIKLKEGSSTTKNREVSKT